MHPVVLPNKSPFYVLLKQDISCLIYSWLCCRGANVQFLLQQPLWNHSFLAVVFPLFQKNTPLCLSLNTQQLATWCLAASTTLLVEFWAFRPSLAPWGGLSNRNPLLQWRHWGFGGDVRCCGNEALSDFSLLTQVQHQLHLVLKNKCHWTLLSLTVV